MNQLKNSSIPGVGFVSTDNGLSIAEMATKLHKHGYISDAEMATDGGVAALRRKLYDGQDQNRHHYSSKRRPWADLTDEEEKQQQLEDERLAREVNECADAWGVNSPEFMSMIILASDLREFGLEVTGMNIVSAEIMASAIQKKLDTTAQNLRKHAPMILRLREMVEWVLDGRPEQQ